MSNQLVEYLKIHRISLVQDLEDAWNNVPLNEDEHFESDDYYHGAIDTIDHLLSVVDDMMKS
jgi:hypothetical protein